MNTGFKTAVLVDIHEGAGTANDDRFRFFNRGEDVLPNAPANGTDAEMFVGAKNAANPTG
ncbi:MAG: hypothetical protein WD851_06085 [Pirellulales bacterium]